MATAPELVISITAAEIAKLDVRPGDILIVHCHDKYLSLEARAAIGEQLREFFPDNKALVIHPDLKLGVLREGADEPVMLDTPGAG